MAVLVTQPEVTVEIAPPSFWGVPTQTKLGAVYELPIQRLQGVDTQEIVEFKPFQVEVGDTKETFYVQSARRFVDDTTPRIGTGLYRVVYPPAFQGNQAILLMPDMSISTYAPILINFVLPPIQPNNAPNRLSIHVVDFGVDFVLAPTADNKLQPMVQVGSTMYPLSDPVDVDRAQWGSYVGSLYFFYTAVRHMDRVIPLFYWRLGGTEQFKVLDGLPITINSSPSGQVYLKGYGAFRFYICEYNYRENWSVYPPLVTSSLASSQYLVVEDVFGRLNHYLGGVIPANPNRYHPKILRKLFVFHKPSLSSGGVWSVLPNVVSINWDTEGGNLEGYNLVVTRGAALRITVGSAQFLYRVTGVTRELTGDSNVERVSVTFKTPLLGQEHTIPVKFNPYLLRVRDIIEAMKCCVHLNFSVSFPPALLDKVIYTNDDMEFNTVEDWADFLADTICEEDDFFGWYIVGNTIVFQSATSPVTLPSIPDDLILQRTVEVGEEQGTVGIVGRVVYFSPDVTQQGFVFKTGTVPTRRKESLRVKGLLLLPQGCFVRLPTNEVAKVTQVRWSLSPERNGETQIEWEVLAL